MMKNTLLLLSAAAMAPERVGATSMYMIQDGQCESSCCTREGRYSLAR